MALPNPFGSNASLKPNFTALNATPKIQTINPGPGLPQALQLHYSNSSVTKRQFTDSKTRVYSSNKNSFSTSQNYSFSCDRCDRSFKNQELLNCHISEHIPCGIDGCPFVAHPKIVEKHIQMQHETGLADQIMRLNTPEEIQKWREARKKHFPSSANIARRQAEQQEKAERGEVLYEPKKKFAKGKSQKGRGWDARRENTRRSNRKDLGDKEQKTQHRPESFSLSPQVQDVKGPPSSIKPSELSNVPVVKIEKELSDGEVVSDNKESVQTVVTGGASALANLQDYATDSEEGETEQTVKKTKVLEEVNKALPASIPASVPASKEHSTKRRKKRKVPGNVPAPKQQLRPKRLTLLQKLLQGEILHERNVILQCVHYIVQQNFFGVGKGSSTIEPSFEIVFGNS